MSNTKVDMPKVAQMFDSGWRIKMFRGGLSSYVIIARNRNKALMDRVRHLLDEDGDLVTDDFTPEQALTRMAYKVFGEILN